MSINQAWQHIKRTPGWCTKPEASVLYRRAAQVKPPGVIVELGAYQGRSAIALAYGSRAGHNVRVHSVDTFAGPPPPPGGPEGYRLSISRAGVADLIELYEARFMDVVEHWSLPIGLLYIDGDHRVVALDELLHAWSRFLLPGASLLIHDIVNRKYPELTAFYRDHLCVNALYTHEGQTSLLAYGTWAGGQWKRVT